MTMMAVVGVREEHVSGRTQVVVVFADSAGTVTKKRLYSVVVSPVDPYHNIFSNTINPSVAAAAFKTLLVCHRPCSVHRHPSNRRRSSYPTCPINVILLLLRVRAYSVSFCFIYLLVFFPHLRIIIIIITFLLFAIYRVRRTVYIYV
jgi:hypothetical protein